MKAVDRLFLAMFCTLLLSALLSSCGSSNDAKPPPYLSSYRDIPGVTEEEIAAIEEIRANTSHFIYGMGPSTEAFLDADGEIKGYAALMCRWLTELFGIEFRPELYTWNALLDGLRSGEIDFNGDLTATEERRRYYFMTDTIAHRSLKLYQIAGSEPLSEIARTRLPRYVLIEKTTTADDVLKYAFEDFEPVYMPEYSDAYELLKSGGADALVTESTSEAFFDIYGDVVTSDFFPLIYSPVSLATQNPALAPFISVMQKALENGAEPHLNRMYDEGYTDYLRHKLFMQLTEEELAYINAKPVIKLGAEFDNYPTSFFNHRLAQWQGICFDVLEEVTTLTELEFIIANDERADFHELLKMLEAGELSILSEVIITQDREGRFLWPKKSFIDDRSVLISRVDQPNISVNRVYSMKVGMQRDTAHLELFQRWFPNHPDTVIYDNQQAAFDAMIRGEIDMVMNNNSTLLYLTNFQELVDFKANIIFDNSFTSTFGFNLNETVLHSILDKALELIDISTITEQWLHRNYDYRLRLAQAQMPWMIGVSALFLVLLLFMTVTYMKNVKRSEAVANQSHFYSSILDAIPLPVTVTNIDMNWLFVNKAVEAFLGKKREDMLGRHCSNWNAHICGTDDCGIACAKRGVKRTFFSQNDLHYQVDVEILKDIEGKNAGFIEVVQDITEHKLISNYEYANKLSAALAEITKSPALCAGIVKDAAEVIAKIGCIASNTNRVGIWSTDEEVSILKNITSYESDVGKYVVYNDLNLSVYTEYAKHLKDERLIVTSQIMPCEELSDLVTQYAPDICAMLDAPIRVDGKLAGVVCIEQDSCEAYPEKREWTIEEQNFASSLADLMALAISNAERRTASQAKSTFLANMSHEVRTPMNAILGLTEILLHNETLPEETLEGLGRIYNSCELLLGIINDILDFSKIEAGKMDISPAQYKVASLINDSIHLNMMRIDNKPIEFELKIDENIPAKLIGDELRIKQILNNLLSNAFKYTDSGKVTLSVKSEPDPEGVMLVLGIQDTGHGMTREQIDQLFKEYYRFIQKTDRTIEGTGLGLAITRRLIVLMDGEIHVESEPDKGSLFKVWLPQKLVDDEVLGRELADNLCNFRLNYMTHMRKAKVMREAMPYGSVLVVDDVETNLYVASGLMKLYKLKIDTVMSGRAAIEKIKSGQAYDIIFMDHMMPEMDGIETTRNLRTMGYAHPIVALTANAVAGQADMFIDNGFDAFISKPIDIRQLNFVLNKFVRDIQPPEVLLAARRQADNAGFNGNDGGSPARQPHSDALLLESFVRDAHKTVSLLEDLLVDEGIENEEELRMFNITVHGIKSSLGNIGEIELSKAAYKLELAGRELNTALINASTPEFISNLRSLLKKIEAEQDEDGTDDNIQALCEKLLAIEKTCADYDRKGVLDELADKNNFSKKTRMVLDNITKLVFHSDFEEAGKTASAYANALLKRMQ